MKQLFLFLIIILALFCWSAYLMERTEEACKIKYIKQGVEQEKQRRQNWIDSIHNNNTYNQGVDTVYIISRVKL